MPVQKNMEKEFRLINIIGIDGAGKTTLAKSLARELQGKGLSVNYKYCQYFAKLLYPVKLIAKLSIMRKTDEFKDYGGYNKTKKQTSSRHPTLANIYAGIWLVDYIIQVFFKIVIDLFLGKKLIIDRYIFDIAVNLSLTTNNNICYAKKIIDFFYKMAPSPDLVIFVDIPEEVAFDRKDDIQDVEYLRERRERYLALIDKYQIKVINGDQTQDLVLKDALEIVGWYE